jgi:N6-L-threonylcarbamoyladenine synthase
MLILGIDTSCDDTSASVVEDGRKIVSNIVSSQSEIHSRYGGIVPELASRRHIEMIMPVVDEAIKQAEISLQDLSAVAVCKGPGLIGSLLIGCSFAKAVCYSRNIPLIAVNHLEGHLLSVFLQSPSPEFPFLSLIVSGGHTSLHIAEDYGRYIEIGKTRDDAAGEAYDKVSKLLGLGYPGGPVIDRLAQKGDPMAIDFPRAYLPESFDFSFSGLKTSVLQFLRKEKLLDTPMPPESELLHNIAASFQAAVVDVLVKKTELAVKKKWIKQVTLSGGVSANSGLRKKMLEAGGKQGFGVYVPPVSLCTDNAAMIAAAAHHRFIKKDFAGLDLNPGAYLSLSAGKM